MKFQQRGKVLKTTIGRGLVIWCVDDKNGYGPENQAFLNKKH